MCSTSAQLLTSPCYPSTQLVFYSFPRNHVNQSFLYNIITFIYRIALFGLTNRITWLDSAKHNKNPNNWYSGAQRDYFINYVRDSVCHAIMRWCSSSTGSLSLDNFIHSFRLFACSVCYFTLVGHLVLCMCLGTFVDIIVVVHFIHDNLHDSYIIINIWIKLKDV